jgi:hypothetical protein
LIRATKSSGVTPGASASGPWLRKMPISVPPARHTRASPPVLGYVRPGCVVGVLEALAPAELLPRLGVGGPSLNAIPHETRLASPSRCWLSRKSALVLRLARGAAYSLDAVPAGLVIFDCDGVLVDSEGISRSPRTVVPRGGASARWRVQLNRRRARSSPWWMSTSRAAHVGSLALT